MSHQFEILHETRYVFSNPVLLEPHLVRLSPRPDFFLRRIAEETIVWPAPIGSAHLLDQNDNRVRHFWFAGETTSLSIQSRLTVLLNDFNPFGILVHPPEALHLPMRYAPEIAGALVYALEIEEDSDALTTFARDLVAQSDSETLKFLERTASTLQRDFFYEVRTFGPPRTASATLQLRSGSCRDLAVLFVQICRSAGIAARFVSGYNIPAAGETPELHAWGEAFVPGGGWIGFDPTLGTAVNGSHIPLAAAARALQTAPVSGTFRGMAQANMEAQITIKEHLVY